jgi:hypothetical protein
MQMLPAFIAGPLHAARGSEAIARFVAFKAPGACRTSLSPRLPFTAIIRQPQYVNLTFLLTEPRAIQHAVPA